MRKAGLTFCVARSLLLALALCSAAVAYGSNPPHIDRARRRVQAPCDGKDAGSPCRLDGEFGICRRTSELMVRHVCEVQKPPEAELPVEPATLAVAGGIAALAIGAVLLSGRRTKREPPANG